MDAAEQATDKFPRREKDADGYWVPVMPEVDPAERRQNAINGWTETLTAKWPDGAFVYTAEARKQAEKRLAELLKEVG